MNQIDFCYDTVRAAKQLGILLRQNGDRFQWLDPAVGVLVEGPDDPNRRESLAKACESLIEYLNSNPRDKKPC